MMNRAYKEYKRKVFTDTSSFHPRAIDTFLDALIFFFFYDGEKRLRKDLIVQQNILRGDPTYECEPSYADFRQLLPYLDFKKFGVRTHIKLLQELKRKMKKSKKIRKNYQEPCWSYRLVSRPWGSIVRNYFQQGISGEENDAYEVLIHFNQNGETFTKEELDQKFPYCPLLQAYTIEGQDGDKEVGYMQMD